MPCRLEAAIESSTAGAGTGLGYEAGRGAGQPARTAEKQAAAAAVHEEPQGAEEEPRFWARAKPCLPSEDPLRTAPSCGESDESEKASEGSEGGSMAAAPCEVLLAACWLLREALSDSCPDVCLAALALLDDSRPLLSRLVPRCEARAVLETALSEAATMLGEAGTPIQTQACAARAP